MRAKCGKIDRTPIATPIVLYLLASDIINSRIVQLSNDDS